MSLGNEPLNEFEEIKSLQIDGFNNYWAKARKRGDGWSGCSRDEADLFIIRCSHTHNTVALPWPGCKRYLDDLLKLLEDSTQYGELKRAREIRLLLQFNQ